MYRSYAITVRPKDGIIDKTVAAISTWLNKCHHAVAVLEKEDHERHLHAQVWFETPKSRGDLCKQVQRICERTIETWDTAQLKVLRSGVKICYSDWYLDYLTDNEDKGEANIIVNNPPEKTMEYYPTEEEQEQVKEVKNSADPRFTQMEIECRKYLGEVELTEKKVAKYLCYAMFEERTMRVVTQQRDRVALCKSLYAYMTKSSDIHLFIPKTKDELKFEEFKNKIFSNNIEWHSPSPSDPEDAELVNLFANQNQ